MLSVFRTISALLAAVVLFGLGNGLFFTLLGIRMSAEGVSSGLIGLVGSAYFAGMLAGILVCERIIRKVGHIRAFTVFAAVSAVAAILHPLLADAWVWMLLRAAMGFAMAGYFMIAESWLQFEASNETRGRTFALYILSHTLGAGLGPLLIIVADPAGWQLFAIATILYSVALLPVALTTMSNPDLGAATRFGIRDLYAISPVAVVGAFAIGLSVSAFSALGPVYAERIGLSAVVISLFMTAPRLGGFVMQYPVGMLSDRFDRRHVMIAFTLATAAVAAAFAGVGAALPRGAAGVELPVRRRLSADLFDRRGPRQRLCRAPRLRRRHRRPAVCPRGRRQRRAEPRRRRHGLVRAGRAVRLRRRHPGRLRRLHRLSHAPPRTSAHGPAGRARLDRAQRTDHQPARSPGALGERQRPRPGRHRFRPRRRPPAVGGPTIAPTRPHAP